MNMKLIATFCCAATMAQAHSDVANEDVQARMNGMTELAEQMKVMASMAKGSVAFDADVVEEVLANLSEEAQNIPALFEEKVDHPASEAKPEIWEAFDAFSALADDLHTQSLALSGTITEVADVAPAMRDIGQSCRACHTEFRE